MEFAVHASDGAWNSASSGTKTARAGSKVKGRLPVAQASLSDRPFEQTALRLDHAVIQDEIAALSEVQAIFAAEDEHKVLHAFVVVDEHSPTIYDRVLAAEGRIAATLPDLELQVHVRASQGRPPSRAVPFTSLPLFIR